MKPAANHRVPMSRSKRSPNVSIDQTTVVRLNHMSFLGKALESI
jgi:hypothetical protein